MDYTWSQQKSFDEHAMYELITCFHEFCNYKYIYDIFFHEILFLDWDQALE